MITEEEVQQRFAYREAMLRHLAEYKVSVLGIAENGIWRKLRPGDYTAYRAALGTITPLIWTGLTRTP